MAHEVSRKLGNLLMSYSGSEPDRVRTAIAELAQDDPQKMEHYVHLAQQNYQEVLRLADVQKEDERRKDELRGMTVNERLGVCRLFDKWDAAVLRRSRADTIAVLRSVEMTEEQAAGTTDAILKEPAKYGF